MRDKPSLPWPDDVGAYCPDVADAISLRDLARERAREARYGLTADEAFAELIAAFWGGELDHLRQGGAVFTLESFPAQSREELDAAAWPPNTLARRAVYWAAREYAGLVAQFWYYDSPDHDLPALGTDEERLRWLAALPLPHYPGVVRGLLGRLRISRTSLRLWAKTPPEKEGRRRGGRERAYWADAEPALLDWLDEEGEPDTQAQAERWLTDYLQNQGYSPAASTIRTHVDRCIRIHRARRDAL